MLNRTKVVARDTLFSFNDFQEILRVQQDVERNINTLKKYTNEHRDVIDTISDKTFKGFNTSKMQKEIMMVWEVDIDDRQEGIIYKTNVYLMKIAGQKGFEFGLHGDIWDIQGRLSWIRDDDEELFIDGRKLKKWFKDKYSIDADIDFGSNEVNIDVNGFGFDGNITPDKFKKIERDLEKNKFVEYVSIDTSKYKITIEFVKNIGY